MALAFKKGDTVEQVMPKPFIGQVTEIQIDTESGDVLFHVACEEGERWFTEQEVKLVQE